MKGFPRSSAAVSYLSLGVKSPEPPTVRPAEDLEALPVARCIASVFVLGVAMQRYVVAQSALDRTRVLARNLRCSTRGVHQMRFVSSPEDRDPECRFEFQRKGRYSTTAPFDDNGTAWRFEDEGRCVHVSTKSIVDEIDISTSRLRDMREGGVTV